MLVTGATGFIGAHVARAALRRGLHVRALCRVGSNRSLLEGEPIEWIRGDLGSCDSLLNAAQGCDAVFHVAADYRLWSADPRELYRVNVEGTRRLLDASKAAGVRRVVYTSSVGVIGRAADGGSADEDTSVDLTQLVGHYKKSKFLAEQEALEAFRRDLDVVIVNPTTPVGAGDIKPTPTGKMVQDFLNGRMPGYLDTGLNLVSVKDVAEGHLLALERGAAGRRYILAGQNLTLRTIFQMLAEISGLPEPRLRIPYPVAAGVGLVSTAAALITRRPPGVSLESVRIAAHPMFFNGSRAVQELGFQQSSVRPALEAAVHWFLENGYITAARRQRIRDSLAFST